MKRILVVDDERQITRMLRAALQSSGYEVICAGGGIEGLDAFKKAPPDLVITDLSMPGMDGGELTRSIRAIAATPILVLTVRSSELQKVSVLDSGADAYLTKPFSMPELLARVRALLRRTEGTTSSLEPIIAGHFYLDPATHTCQLRGEPVRLTPKEFRLLELLLRSAGKVVAHRELLRSIWGATGEDQPEYLRVLVGTLRKKLESNQGTEYLENQPKIGYRLTPEGCTR